MTTITYLKGDATSPQARGNKIIGHVCNDIGAWGKGFVMAISARWPEPEKEYRKWHRTRAQNNFALGEIQLISVEKYVCVANMIGQHGIKTGSKGVPIRYEAIEACLEKLAQEALEKEASVHLPRIGCGLAGGTWVKIEPLITKTLLTQDILVFVYDFD